MANPNGRSDTLNLRTHLAQSLAAELRRASTNNEALPELADVLFRDALRERATDVHLDPTPKGMRVRFRIDGSLLDVLLLGHEEGSRLLRHIKTQCGLDTTNHWRPGNARMTLEMDERELDLRLASAPCIAGEKLSIRLLDRSRVGQRLDELGMDDSQRDQVEEWLSNAEGMFLVAGPTGSGKTTTLYALLHELKLHDRSIITVEDPVEYRIDEIVQIPVDARHELTFGSGLRAALRLDPDYLLLGELRHPDDVHAGIEAAGSGRVLMSTLHSPDAVGAVTALRNLGAADHEIAASLRMVVAQRLVRRLCRRCRRREALDEASRNWLGRGGVKPVDEVWSPVGCEHCRGIGYDGRFGIFEVWDLTDADYHEVLTHGDERSLRNHVHHDHLRTLLQVGYEKVKDGSTTLAELRSACPSFMAPAQQPHRRAAEITIAR